LMSLAFWLNSAWMLKCARQRNAFRRATRRVEYEQAEVLRAILAANRDTEFGRRHAFDSIGCPRQFQDLVPPSVYEDYREPIVRMAAGHANVLTAERVRLFEPTSGSSGAEKLIPYTAGLRRQFQRGLSAWIGDLLMNRPALRGGRAYWSISPSFGSARRTSGGIPIGFDDDAAYLGGIERWAVRRLLVAPSRLSQCDDLEMFRYWTLLCLLAADDLALISIWNPTFLSALLVSLPEWLDRLCDDLRHGTAPGKWGPQRNGAPALAANPRRADALTSISRSAANWPAALREIWPRLALISCWTDAAAIHSVGELRATFPQVEIQPKGLLATEAIVSIPLLDCPAPALAVRSHFFEFLEVDVEGAGIVDSRRARLAHELDRGGRYQIVLTTAGGLYRYCLGDEVEVVGFSNQCPLFRFLGRGDHVSDMVGEKLAEPHVRLAVDRSLAVCGLEPRFSLLTPLRERPVRYRFYLQLATGAKFHPTMIDQLQRLLEAHLAENPHYRYAVGLCQLAPVEIRPLDAHGEPAWQLYQRRCLARGQKAGNIKPVALDTWDGWPEVFRPLEIVAPWPTAADKCKIVSNHNRSGGRNP
jgi:hypothetical protein